MVTRSPFPLFAPSKFMFCLFICFVSILNVLWLRYLSQGVQCDLKAIYLNNMKINFPQLKITTAVTFCDYLLCSPASPPSSSVVLLKETSNKKEARVIEKEERKKETRKENKQRHVLVTVFKKIPTALAVCVCVSLLSTNNTSP